MYIVIPAYKSANFIKECLDSATIQKDSIVLLGIDGCQETLNKVKTLKYDNVKVYWYPENKGTYITLNSLIQHIPDDSNFIVFGSDDIMYDNLVVSMENHIPCISRYDGVLCLSKQIYNEFGGFKPWRVAADTDMLKRIGRKYKITRLPILYFRRTHPNQLTKGSMGFGSSYRKSLANQIELDLNKGILYVKPEVNIGVKVDI